jgi:transcriptional regulator with XRE-family HTH domain
VNYGEGLLGTSSGTVEVSGRFREAGRLNEPLRQALLRAGLREDDVAAQLGVDPKTVRRWLTGRVPYPSSRAALADLVGVDEADLWPDAGGPLTSRTRPEELGAVYPHRWAIPRDVWKRLFESAEHEIGVLAYSALFLAEDAGMLAAIADRARSGVRVRLALGDPDGACVAQRGQEEGIGDAMPAKVRNALTLFCAALKVENVEIRLHDTVLYNSIYRADDQLFVNQHAYGLPAAHAPVFCFRESESRDMTTAYLNSFEVIWVSSSDYLNNLEPRLEERRLKFANTSKALMLVRPTPPAIQYLDCPTERGPALPAPTFREYSSPMNPFAISPPGMAHSMESSPMAPLYRRHR